MANPLPLVALAGNNLGLTASFTISNEDPDYPASNLEWADPSKLTPAKVAKSLDDSATVGITTASASVVAVALINTNAVFAQITAGATTVSIAIPSLDYDGQRVHGWLDRRTVPLGPTTTWSVHLVSYGEPVWIGHIALLTSLSELNLKYGFQEGRRRPGDIRHITRLGTRIDESADIRTRWAKGVVDLEDDVPFIKSLDASAKGGALPFIFIPDEAVNDAWLVKFANDFSLSYPDYGVRPMPLEFDELSSGPPNG